MADRQSIAKIRGLGLSDERLCRPDPEHPVSALAEFVLNLVDPGIQAHVIQSTDHSLKMTGHGGTEFHERKDPRFGGDPAHLKD